MRGKNKNALKHIMISLSPPPHLLLLLLLRKKNMRNEATFDDAAAPAADDDDENYENSFANICSITGLSLIYVSLVVAMSLE